jgi:hypothetical protein
MDGQHQIEQMGEMDAVRLGDKAEQASVAVKTPWPAQLDHLDPRLVMAVEEFVCDFPVGGLVGEFQRFRPRPLHADHRNKAVRQNAAHGGVGRELFELAHIENPSAHAKRSAARIPAWTNIAAIEAANWRFEAEMWARAQADGPGPASTQSASMC